MNQLHPVYHGYSYNVGSRIDIDRVLPPNLDDADLDEWLDKLSEPPKYIERIAPVSTVIGTDIVRGKNWSEMTAKSYRVFLRIFTSIAYYIRQALADKFNERGMIPFTSCCVDPDTLHRIVELDYEQGENTYGTFMELYRSGVMAPCVTVPFHAILPLLPSDFDRRLCVRIGFELYWRILKDYHHYIRGAHGDSQFIVTMWLPDCGYSHNTLKIVHEEFKAFTKKQGVPHAHLVLLLDNAQAADRDTDVLMKSWNQVPVGKDRVSVVFRDRAFSEWVTYSNPSVKKLIDRTIAKVDSELNEAAVNYCWAHFEEIEALTFSSKSAQSFEQKVVKLAQLSYMAVSPDMFIRRKMNGKFGRGEKEPMEVRLLDNTGWNDSHTNISLGRWEGVLDSNAVFKLVDENHPYVRRTRAGKVHEIGPQCWKLAFNKARDICAAAVKGDPKTLKGGFLEVLADICGHKDPKILHRNVEEFLVHYTYVHWREHFIQGDMSEAEIQLTELVHDYLMKDCRKRLRDEHYIMAGVAAQGYFFALDAQRSQATYYENLDQRAVYQNVAMLTLAMCNHITLMHWLKKPAEGRKALDLLKLELLDFASAYQRHRLADYGVTEQEWRDSIKSMVDETDMNIVARAARRTAARHLRPLGYRKDFTREDEYLSSNCGHIWTAEVENTNYKWENKLFCGMREE